MTKAFMGSRAKQLREILGYSINKVAKEVGVTYQIISKIEAGIIKSPRGSTLYKLAKTLKTTPEYLIEGEGFSRVYDDVKNKIPVLTAKEAIEWCSTDIKYIIAHDKEYLNNPLDLLEKNVFAFKIATDAMSGNDEKSIQKGSIAICKPTKEIKQNKIFLFYDKNEGGVFIREIIFDGKTYLKPLNHQFGMIELLENIQPIAEILAVIKLFWQIINNI